MLLGFGLFGRLDGRMDGWMDGWTDSPCVLQDFVTFWASALLPLNLYHTVTSRAAIEFSLRYFHFGNPTVYHYQPFGLVHSPPFTLWLS